MSRRHNPTKARRHWVLDREDICGLFEVGDSTITNWVRRGLKPVDGHRPQLFAGYALRQFLTDMRWPEGRAPKNGRLFCPCCQGFKAVASETILTALSETKCLSVTGICSNCRNMLQADVTPDGLSEIYLASQNTSRHPPDVNEDVLSQGIARNGISIPPENNSSNLRWLYGYRIYLESNQEWDVRTVDEHLRAIARMSTFVKHKPFEAIAVADVRNFKDELRRRRELNDHDCHDGLSKSTVVHTLDRCGAFFRWLQRRPSIDMDPDLPGYFKLSRKERSAESDSVKGTSLSFAQALCIFVAMPSSEPIDLRNRAVIAMFIVTGIRVAALISLLGKHVNTFTRWVNQDPREVNTKMAKHIRTYMLDLGSGLLDAIEQWARWREVNGFGGDAPYFLPDRYIQPNSLGLGFRPNESSKAKCWKADDSIQRIIKDAAQIAGIVGKSLSSHDFRKIQHPFLSKRGNMVMIEEVALQLNFGHTPTETIRKHYASMLDSEREEILDELCGRALSDRTELELYLAFARNDIMETDHDYRRAKNIYERNALV